MGKYQLIFFYSPPLPKASKVAQFGWIFLAMPENVLALTARVAKALSCMLSRRVVQPGKAKVESFLLWAKQHFFLFCFVFHFNSETSVLL